MRKIKGCKKKKKTCRCRSWRPSRGTRRTECGEVWEAEREAAREKKKIVELQREIEEERRKMEMRKLQEDAANFKDDIEEDRLDVPGWTTGRKRKKKKRKAAASAETR